MKPNSILCLTPLLLVACSTTTGRYLQVRSPMNDTVVAQLTYPTSTGCAYVLQSLKYGNDKVKQAASVSSCRDTGAPDMKTRATLRDKTGNYLFDVETPAPPQCTSFVNEVLKDSNDAVEVVSACKKK